MLGTNSSTYTPHWLPTAGATQKLGKGGIKKHKRRSQLASEAYRRDATKLAAAFWIIRCLTNALPCITIIR